MRAFGIQETAPAIITDSQRMLDERESDVVLIWGESVGEKAKRSALCRSKGKWRVGAMVATAH